MYKISHIIFKTIQIVAICLAGLFLTCYLPSGAFLATSTTESSICSDTLWLSVPKDFRPYPYFSLKDISGQQVVAGTLLNDSVVQFVLPPDIVFKRGNTYRVEATIIPVLPQ